MRREASGRKEIPGLRCATPRGRSAAEPGDLSDVPECSMSGAHIKCAKRTQFRENARSSLQGQSLREVPAQEVARTCQNVPSPRENGGTNPTHPHGRNFPLVPTSKPATG